MAGDSGRRVIPGPDLFDQGVELAQNGRESIEELLAFCGHDKRAFGSIDELYAEEFLEVLDALARGALGHAMLDGRMGEASFAHHIVEDLERPNVDRLTSRLFICFTNFGSPSIKFRHLGYRFGGGTSRLGLGARRSKKLGAFGEMQRFRVYGGLVTFERVLRGEHLLSD